VTSESNAIMLRGLDTAIHGAAGAAVGFGIGMVIAVAIYLGNR